MRYQEVQIRRPGVPMVAPPDQLVGRTISECIPKDLVFQVVSAAERAICLQQPIEIRYPLILFGRLVMSRATILADATSRTFTMQIMRLAALALAVGA